MYRLDKYKIKEQLTPEMIFQLLEDLGGEPAWDNDVIISQTICHNLPGEGSRKLYYYPNTKLFKCWTHCGDTIDVFDLVSKVLTITKGKQVPLPDSISYVASYFKISSENFLENNIVLDEISKSFQIFNKYHKITETKKPQIVELKTYNEKILDHFPRARIEPWEQEGITPAAERKFNIRYDPKYQGVIIPHYDINGNLVGIRSRCIDLNYVDYGKYRPTKIGNIIYSHPLGFNLYGLNINKENIIKEKKAIVCESEKAVMQGEKILGPAANIIVACCGSNLSQFQFNILYSLGINELILAYDKQWQKLGTEEWNLHIKLLEKLTMKFSKYVNVTCMEDWSDDSGLDYKNSPTDKGSDKFIYLYNKRRKVL